MKNLLHAALCAVCLVPTGAEAEMRLERRAIPCDDFSGTVWTVMDFEPADEDMGTSYAAYGDTLLSETVDGRRIWYFLRGDTALMVREETDLMEAVPDTLVTAWDWNMTGTPISSPMTTRGMYSQMFHITTEGSAEAYPPVEGRLVATPGDTIPAIMTRERRVFRSLITAGPVSPQMVESADTLPVYEVTHTRWYGHGDRIYPLARQTDTRIIAPDGKVAGEYSAAYIADAPLREQHDTPQNMDGTGIARALKSASAACSSGHISVGVDGGDAGFVLTVDVTDEGGILYSHKEAWAKGPTTVDISTLGMPSGRYIVTIGSTATPVTEKRLLII